MRERKKKSLAAEITFPWCILLRAVTRTFSLGKGCNKHLSLPTWSFSKQTFSKGELIVLGFLQYVDDIAILTGLITNLHQTFSAVSKSVRPHQPPRYQSHGVFYCNIIYATEALHLMSNHVTDHKRTTTIHRQQAATLPIKSHFNGRFID